MCVRHSVCARVTVCVCEKNKLGGVHYVHVCVCVCVGLYTGIFTTVSIETFRRIVPVCTHTHTHTPTQKYPHTISGQRTDDGAETVKVYQYCPFLTSQFVSCIIAENRLGCRAPSLG